MAIVMRSFIERLMEAISSPGFGSQVRLISTPTSRLQNKMSFVIVHKRFRTIGWLPLGIRCVLFLLISTTMLCRLVGMAGMGVGFHRHAVVVNPVTNRT
jgi:hypothetical protein